MNESLEREITTSGSKASYDEFAKRLLAQKIILAHILIHTTKEFAHMKPEQVVPLIEGEAEIAITPVIPGQTNNSELKGILPAITGGSTESKIPYEGVVTFDIRFFAWIPEKKEKVKIIVDIEAQKMFSPGYDLVTRGIFYASRLISAQLDTEFTIPHYDDIKKVYSIWICMNAPKSAENTITEFHVERRNLVGDAKDIGRYDLLGVIMVGLSKKLIEGDIDELKLHRLLGTLFKSDITPDEKKDILSREFEIPMTEEIERSVESMCNLSEAIAEEYMEKGIECGILKGMERGIEKGMERGIETGMERGIKKGMERGIETGIERGIETIIANFLRKDNHISNAVIMLDVSAKQVCAVAKKQGIAVEK